MTEEKKEKKSNVINAADRFQKLPGAPKPGFKNPKMPTKRQMLEKTEGAVGGLEKQINAFQQILQSIAKKQYEMEQGFNQSLLQLDVITLSIKTVLFESLGVKDEDWANALTKATLMIKEQQEKEFDARNGFVTVDREIKEGDFAAIGFVGKLNGNEFPGGTTQFQMVKVGGKQFLPELEVSLIGKKADDEYIADVTFPKDYKPENIAGKLVNFEIKVLAVKEKVKVEAEAPPVKIEDSV